MGQLETVLVTGGAGFIGSHTVDMLINRGYRVRILDNLQKRVHPSGAPCWLNGEAEFIEGDVANQNYLAGALTGINVVFHLAANQDYLTDFSTYVHVNAESAALFFELVVSDPKRYPVEKLIFASSQSISGEGRYLSPSALACQRCRRLSNRSKWVSVALSFPKISCVHRNRDRFRSSNKGNGKFGALAVANQCSLF